MKKRIVSFVCLSMMSLVCLAQSREVKKDFKFLIKTVESDYPGFETKVKSGNRSDYIKFRDSLKDVLTDVNSYDVYRTYANFFKDYHLNVRKTRNSSNQVLNLESSYGKPIDIDENSAKDYMKNTKDLASIEGFWFTKRGKKIFIKKEKNSFVSMFLNDSGSWKRGDVNIEFVPKSNSEYTILFHTKHKDVKPRKGIASLEMNEKVLEIHGRTCLLRSSDIEGKLTLSDKAFIRSYRMKYPNGINTYSISKVLSDSTYYIRVSSFSSYDKRFIQKTFARDWEIISHSPNLIIDIRNNGGGQDGAYRQLANVIYTTPYMSKGVEWYATKARIKRYKSVIKNKQYRDGEEGRRWMLNLLNAMKSNVGGYVIHPEMGKDVLVKRDTVFEYPKKVGIIMNEGCASSAEQFLLTAKYSKKVILFGNKNSAGVLDYSNTVPVYFPSNNFYVRVPETRSRRLPENPIDNVGISPDVNIPYPSTKQLYDDMDSWAKYVKSYLEMM